MLCILGSVEILHSFSFSGFGITYETLHIIG